MAVTTASITLNFNVGPFGQTTSLVIPDAALADKISFQKNVTLSQALPQFDPVDGNNATIYLLCRVLFNGVEVYKHPQYDINWVNVFIGDPGPTGANATVAVTNFSTTPVEVITQNNPPAVQKNSAGEVQNGVYTIYIKYVYPTGNADGWNQRIVTYSNVNFAYTRLSPILSYWYDTAIPTLEINDTQSYIVNANQANRNIEFALTYPLDYGQDIQQFDNIPTINYGMFYTQTSELVYTILLTYKYGIFNVVTVEQQYLAVNVIYIDRWVIFECLNTLYEQWIAASCGTMSSNLIYQKLQQANILANLIVNGLGCGSHKLSNLIAQFNGIASCDCGCDDTTLPRLIGY
jgi:hypothetical protein